jgi:NAD-dependent dihydropyrimidine dehydrogenase PreA subunit
MDWRKELAKEWTRIRTLRKMAIHFDETRCRGDWECYQVCPAGCWTPDAERGKAAFEGDEQCVACGACVLQCPHQAIELR